MEHFVTLFDQVFLPQGLALHMSMQKTYQRLQTVDTLHGRPSI